LLHLDLPTAATQSQAAEVGAATRRGRRGDPPPFQRRIRCLTVDGVCLDAGMCTRLIVGPKIEQ
jgi:hypothetical protein